MATTISCPAGVWTNVLWRVAVGITSTNTVSISNPSVNVKYRKYGAGIPPYWSGSFKGSKTFTLQSWDVYIRVDLKPDSDIIATVS